uniref:IQ motif containing C n=1 Tax=Aquila chrysaetos chrysaetos TaxID=223781 RepID=A0A663EJ57_AQUCH
MPTSPFPTQDEQGAGAGGRRGGGAGGPAAAQLPHRRLRRLRDGGGAAQPPQRFPLGKAAGLREGVLLRAAGARAGDAGEAGAAPLRPRRLRGGAPRGAEEGGGRQEPGPAAGTPGGAQQLHVSWARRGAGAVMAAVVMVVMAVAMAVAVTAVAAAMAGGTRDGAFPTALSLDPRSDRSCTWQRAPTPRTRRLDPTPGPARRGGRHRETPREPHNGATPRPMEGPMEATPVTQRGDSGAGRALRGQRTFPPPLHPTPAPAAISVGPTGGGDDAISRRPVVGAAMAAALGPQAEAEGWRRLLRAVTRLQACVRGYLLRKRFRSLREEYEEVVREIEGDLSRLEWRGRFLPRPLFVPEKPAQGKRSGPLEAVPSDEASAEKPQEEVDASEPERDWDCSSVKPTAQLESQKELSSTGEGDAATPPNPGADADKCTEKECAAPAESEDWQNDSNVSSVWDSAVLEAESFESCLEIPLEDIKDLPRTRSGLQSYRNHLIMELLWLQQAIVSRKNYLMLKQRLGTPDP